MLEARRGRTHQTLFFSQFILVPEKFRRPQQQYRTPLSAHHAVALGSLKACAAAVGIPDSGPLTSLNRGTWFKLICGASSHDVPAIRNAALVYTLAGADCIDVAADSAALAAAHEGVTRALQLATTLAQTPSPSAPLLMVSVTDSVDPHFRKAEFPSAECPRDCPRPCERICPAAAIVSSGVIADKCYGCGRCVPACPLGIIRTYDVVHSRADMRALLRNPTVGAIEIHTCRENMSDFSALWSDIGAVIVRNVQLVAVSFPNPGSDAELRAYLRDVWGLLRNGAEELWCHPSNSGGIRLVWQCDGLPMSGDVGRGTAKKSVKLAGRVCQALVELGIPGHVQPAGGTNEATVPLLFRAGLLRDAENDRNVSVSGVAMGGYARKVLRDELAGLTELGSQRLEENAELFASAKERAREVVRPIKAIPRKPQEIPM